LVSSVSSVDGVKSVRGDISTERLVVTDKDNHKVSPSGGARPWA